MNTNIERSKHLYATFLRSWWDDFFNGAVEVKNSMPRARVHADEYMGVIVVPALGGHPGLHSIVFYIEDKRGGCTEEMVPLYFNQVNSIKECDDPRRKAFLLKKQRLDSEVKEARINSFFERLSSRLAEMKPKRLSRFLEALGEYSPEQAQELKRRMDFIAGLQLLDKEQNTRRM